MKTFFFSIILLVLTSFQTSYKTYFNSRFEFSVKYPSSFIPQEEPENGDGRSFLSKDRKVKISASANYLVEPNELEQYYNAVINGDSTEAYGQRIKYKFYKNNYFVVSTDYKGKITYQKSVRRSDIIQTLVITYPTSMKSAMDATVNTIAASFK